MSHQPSLKHLSSKETPKHLYIPPADSFRPISPCSVSSSRRGKDTPSKMVRSGAETPSSFSSVYLQNLSHIVLKPNSTNPEPSNTTSGTNNNPLFRPLVKQYSLDHKKMFKGVKTEPKKNSNSFSPKKHLSNEKKSSPVHEQSTFSTIAAQRVNEAQFFKSTNTDLINREASTQSPQKRIAINRSQRASHGHEFHDIMQTSSPAEKFKRKDQLHPDQKEGASYVSIRKMKQEYYDSPRSIRSQGGYHFSKRTSTDFSISVHQSELSSRHLQTENYSQLDDKAYLLIPSSPLTVRESTESEAVSETLHTDVSLIDMISNPHHKSSPTNQDRGITEGFSSFHKNRPDYNHKIFSPSIRKSKIEIIKQHLDEPKTIDVILIDGKWRSINDVQEICHLQQSLAESVSRNSVGQNTPQKRRPIKSRSTHQLDLLHVVGEKHSEHQVKSEVIDDTPKKTNNFKKQKSHDNLVKRPNKIDDLFTHHKRSEATTPKIDDLFTHHKRNEAKITQIHVLPPQNGEHTIFVSSYIESQEGRVSAEKFKKANFNREYQNESESIPQIQELPQKEEESATSTSNHTLIQEETEKPKRANLNREAEPVPQNESIPVVNHYSYQPEEENNQVSPIHHEEENIISEENSQNQQAQDFEHEVQIDKTAEVQEAQAEVDNSETQNENEISTQQQKQEYSGIEGNSNEEKVYQNDLHAEKIVHHIKCPVEDVICEVEEEQETGNEDQEIDQNVEDKISQEEESSASIKVEEQGYPMASEKESLHQPTLNSSTEETALELIQTEKKKEEEKSQKTLCEVEEKQDPTPTVRVVHQEEESSIQIKEEALTEEQENPVDSEKETLHQTTLNSSTVETALELIHTEERKEEEQRSQKAICKVEEKQETINTVKIVREEEESSGPMKEEAQTGEQVNPVTLEREPILNASTKEIATELIHTEERKEEEKSSHDGPQTEGLNEKTICEVEEKQEIAPIAELAQEKEEPSAPIKNETHQPILNSSTIKTASELIQTEVRKEQKPQKTIYEVEVKEKQQAITIAQDEESNLSSKDEARIEEQKSTAISEKENSRQLNIQTRTVESTPKILHTEERKEEEKLSQDGSQTDKKAHDLSSPSSFLGSEDRSHTHDWNHLIGDSLKIKKFGEHYPSSQNGLDDHDHEHEQDMTTIFEENIAKFETLKKLNNQDGAVHLLKEVSDDLERYIQEKAKPQDEATAKVLKIHVYNRLGVEYYEKGQYEEAIQQCKKTLEVDHSNIQALFKLYQTNSKLGKKDQASNVIKRVRKIMQNPFLYQYNQQFMLDKFTMPTQTNSQSNQSLQDMHDSRLSFF